MIKLKAFAKLNLNLHIIPQRFKNGLYPVRFINCQLDLHDELFFKRIDNKIEIISNNSQLPKEEDNLIYKTAVLLKRLVNNPKLGAKIILKKNIPIKAGLGGGSSDAAMTIKGLMKLWNVKLTKNQQYKLAGSLGKDVFYCLKGNVCEVLGDGSIVNSLNIKMPIFWLLIITPKEKKPSTEWMYKNLNARTIGKNLNKFNDLKKAIFSKNKKAILADSFNDFEGLVINRFPIVKAIKHELLNQGAVKILLAGSGLSMVGFFSSKKQAQKAFNNLKFKYRQILWTQTKKS